MPCLLSAELIPQRTTCRSVHPDCRERIEQRARKLTDSANPTPHGRDQRARRRVRRVGYPWTRVAENVAFGYLDTASVMAAWMASDDHRGSILSANTHIGVGLAYDADGLSYWTQVFASSGWSAVFPRWLAVRPT